MCGGVSEVCSLAWLTTNSARKISCGVSWISLLICLKSNWWTDAEEAGRNGWLGDILQPRWLKLSLKLQEEPVVSSVAWPHLDRLFHSLFFAWVCVGQGEWHVRSPLVGMSRGLFVSCRVQFWRSLLTSFNKLLSSSKTRIMVLYWFAS